MKSQEQLRTCLGIIKADNRIIFVSPAPAAWQNAKN